MTSPEIAALNDQFSMASPQDVLSFLIGRYPKKIVLASSLGAEDQVLTDMVCNCTGSCAIFVLDTKRLHDETLTTMARTEQRYGFSYKVYSPNPTDVDTMVSTHGENLFYNGINLRKLCCNIRKVQPLQRALAGYSVWVTGIRRSQSVSRKNAALFEWDATHDMIKVNPLIDWTTDDVWAYIKQQDIPYNPLHEKGYGSIGCEPCTRATKPGEDERSGRWWWESNSSKECGLHV